MKHEYGEYFGVDLILSTFCFDEQAMLKCKYNPVKLGGRAEKLARRETIERSAELICYSSAMVVIEEIIDDEPDVIGEHLKEKAKHRAHREASRFQKVRKPDLDASLRMKERREGVNRSSRRSLNQMEVIAEKDIIRKYRSTFSDEGAWSVRGSRNLDA